jgi:DNA-binding MurR/RpiR family transcriptional regulator
MTQPGVAESIRQRMGECSPAERKVARVLLASYPSAGFETVARLAERAGVSGPTVVRFVTRLGYTGFPDFQRALRDDLDERSASPSAIYARGGLPVDPHVDLIERAGRIAVGTLQRTFDRLVPHDLDRSIELLSDARRVYVAGGRYSGLLGQLLAQHLQQLRPGVSVLAAEPSARVAQVADLTKHDLLVVFDYRRYEPHLLALAAQAKRQHLPVILFTDAWLSPIASDADVVLPSETEAPSPFDALTPVLALVETVVAGVLARLGSAATERMAEADRVAEELRLY